MALRRDTDPRDFGLSEDELRALGFRHGPASEEPRKVDVRLPADPPVDRAWVGWLATVVVLLLVAWAGSPKRRLPSAVSASARNAAFSSARAMAQLVELTRQPHAIGSPGHDQNRDLLLSRLRSTGLEPEVQTTMAATADSGTLRVATVRNLVARASGSASTGAVALVAHYDAAPLSPGASDDALVVAVVLEAARALMAGGTTRNDVVVILSDAGEVGGLGARSFVESHRWASDVAVAIVVDVRGGVGPAITVSAAPGGGLPLDPAIGAGPGATSLVHALVGAAGRHGSLAPFIDGGSRGLRISTVAAPARRHQPTDLAPDVREETLQDVGRSLLAITRNFAEADLGASVAADSTPVAYFSLPLLGLVQYPQRRALLIGVGLLGAWVLMGVFLHLRWPLGRATVAGMTVGLLGVGGSAGAARALFETLRDRHAEFGTLETAFYADGLHVGAVAALAFAVVSATYAIARRWFRVDEVLVAALALPLGFALWVGFEVPPAAAAVQWPLATALLGTALLMFAGPRHRKSGWTRVLLVLLSCVFLVLAVPSLELLAAVWTFREATRLGLVFALGALALLPVIDALTSWRAWMTPTLGLVLAAALVTVGSPAVKGPDDHPVPTTLVYMADEPAETRLPIGSLAVGQRDGSETRRMDGRWLTVPGPGEQWARSWVADAPTGTTDPGIVFLAPGWLYEVAGTGPTAQLAPPRARLVESSLDGSRRLVRLAVAPGLRGEMLALHLPAATGATFVGVGGAPLTAAALFATDLTHWGRPADGELLVDVSLPLESPDLELVIVEHHLRPREVLGDHVFQRADSLVANAAAGSDRVIQRSVVRLRVTDGANAVAEG